MPVRRWRMALNARDILALNERCRAACITPRVSPQYRVSDSDEDALRGEASKQVLQTSIRSSSSASSRMLSSAIVASFAIWRATRTRTHTHQDTGVNGTRQRIS